MALTDLQDEFHVSCKLLRDLVSFTVHETGDIKVIYTYAELPSRVKQIVFTVTEKKKKFELVNIDHNGLLERMLERNKGKAPVFEADLDSVRDFMDTAESIIAEMQAIADGKDVGEYANRRASATDKRHETNVLMAMCIEYGIDLESVRQVESIVRRNSNLDKQQIEDSTRDLLKIFSKI